MRFQRLTVALSKIKLQLWLVAKYHLITSLIWTQAWCRRTKVRKRSCLSTNPSSRRIQWATTHRFIQVEVSLSTSSSLKTWLTTRKVSMHSKCFWTRTVLVMIQVAIISRFLSTVNKLSQLSSNPHSFKNKAVETIISNKLSTILMLQP